MYMCEGSPCGLLDLGHAHDVSVRPSRAGGRSYYSNIDVVGNGMVL